MPTLQKKPEDINRRSADMWSFAVLLWELVTREVPFADLSNMEIGMKVALEGLRPTIPPGISPHICKLMKICMNEDPAKRPKFDMIVPILEKMQDKLERATKVSSTSSVAGPSAALGAPEPLLHDLSQHPLLDIPDAQAPRSCAPSPQARRVKRSRQARDIMDLKAQALATVPTPMQPQLPYPPSSRRDQGGWEEASQLVQKDTLSIVASGDGASFSSDMQVRGELEPHAVEEPGFEVASEASAPPLSSSVSALMGHAAAFLQVPWTLAAEPHQSIFQAQAMAPRPQKFPLFPDFMEEVRSSWDRPVSGAEKLGLAGFPPVDSTIASLVKAQPVGGVARDLACPNPQCRVMETHLKRVYAAEAQATRLSNTASVLTAYMYNVLRKALLPEPVATELCLLSSMLLQISSLQGQALGPRTYLWASRGGDLAEIPPGRSIHWRAPQTWTVTRTVPVPTAQLGDQRHRLQGTEAANNRAQAGRGNAGLGQPTHQHPRQAEGMQNLASPASQRRSCSRLRRSTGELLRRGLSPGQFQSPQLSWVTKGIAYRAQKQQTTGPRQAEETQDLASPHTSIPGRQRECRTWPAQRPSVAVAVACTSDTWVLATVQNGYALQFRLGPPPFRGITNTFVTDPHQALVLQKELPPCCASEPFVS
ncbi:UNVERIFIED_CONTAM: hypothetical protein FKN15_068763 [Acipenser sinensis]